MAIPSTAPKRLLVSRAARRPSLLFAKGSVSFAKGRSDRLASFAPPSYHSIVKLNIGAENEEAAGSADQDLALRSLRRGAEALMCRRLYRRDAPEFDQSGRRRAHRRTGGPYQAAADRPGDALR